MVDFQKIVGSFIELVDTVSKEVENEKMKVILVYLLFSVLEFQQKYLEI